MLQYFRIRRGTLDYFGTAPHTTMKFSTLLREAYSAWFTIAFFAMVLTQTEYNYNENNEI